MKPAKTSRDSVQHDPTQSLAIDGVLYYPALDIAKWLGLSRQTLWRWRQDGKIPLGHRFRNGQLFFTAQEREAIFEYTNHIEPARMGTQNCEEVESPAMEDTHGQS